MLSPARILALALRWIALICGIFAMSTGAAGLVVPGWSIGTTTFAVTMAIAILLWMAAGFIDQWISRHARRRLQALLAIVQAQEGSLPSGCIEPASRRDSAKLQIGQLATSPRSAE